MFDATVREFQNVRNAPQLKKNLISVGALQTQGLKVTLGEGILKMLSGSLDVLNSTRRNNLYYLKVNAINENLAAPEYLDVDSIRL